MFDLKPGVHLNEVMVVIRVDEEFTGSRVFVSRGLCESDCVAANVLTELLADERRWSNFDDFLVASLHGAVTLKQVYDIAILVSENLNFDVPWCRDELLKEHASITECGPCLARRGHKSFCQLFLIGAQTHTSTTSSERSLCHNGVAHFLSEFKCLLDIAYNPVTTGYNWHVCFKSEITRGGFGTHHINRLAVRSNEDDACLFTSGSEVTALGEETVSRVNGVNLMFKCYFDNLVNVEIRIDGA
mmetsp:Transcript_14040/g.25357  ORF Transcript_14040/g.25357 Transcript_14040/m.25357 type:complete len:244 (-) Transcript_14040:404-1135(-)